MTIEEESLLQRLWLHPGEADRLRRLFSTYYHRAAEGEVFDEKCPNAKRIFRLVHAAISLAEDGRFAN